MVTDRCKDDFIECLHIECELFFEFGPVMQVDDVEDRRVDESLDLDARLVEQCESDQNVERSTNQENHLVGQGAVD